MMKIKNEREIFEAVIKVFGANFQEGICQEECAELIQAISKKHRGKKHNIPEEIADVEIMLEQMKIINQCDDEVKQIRAKKIENLCYLFDITKGE